jgi:hypothetical protein
MPMKGKKRLAKTNKKSIPDEVKKQVDETVKEFNQKILKDPNYYYVTRYKFEFRLRDCDLGKAE